MVNFARTELLRELLIGSHKFNVLARGLPDMSRTLLTTRLRQLRQFYLVASMTVARHKFDLGQYGLAVERARQALSVEPALEPAHRLLIQCLLETGHLDSAICQYRTCKAELARREDRAPAEQTRMLYQRLLENPQLD